MIAFIYRCRNFSYLIDLFLYQILQLGVLSNLEIKSAHIRVLVEVKKYVTKFDQTSQILKHTFCSLQGL